MKMTSIVLWLVALAPIAAVPAPAQVPYKIVTASERGTYIQIGRDLAKFVAPEAGIRLDVLPSAGSAENVQRLIHETGVKLALVQSDVYQAFLDHGAGNPEAGALVRSIRVVMPLYNEEIYFIARADSDLNFVHEIKGRTINVGPPLSGTAMTATRLYRQMFHAPLAESHASFLSNEEALVKLAADHTLDVVVVVAGQPAKLLADMTPAARRLIKLLKFDAAGPEGAAALQTYFPASVRASNYPNLLTEDLPSLAVKAYLVTVDFSAGDAVSHLKQFARSLCNNIRVLQASGHPKWREVSLTLPDLGKGWSYYPPMAEEIRSCAAKPPSGKPVKGCSQQEQVLGLCG